MAFKVIILFLNARLKCRAKNRKFKLYLLEKCRFRWRFLDSFPNFFVDASIFIESRTRIILMELKLIKIESQIDERANDRKVFEKAVRPFVEKSLSEETRRAYGRVVKEFFTFYRNIEPTEVKPIDVIRWRDSLIENKRSAATVAFKLSVVRSLFEYLKAGGLIQNNPALSKLVTPPKLSEDLRGRALTVKEVNYILACPTAENSTAHAITPFC